MKRPTLEDCGGDVDRLNLLHQEWTLQEVEQDPEIQRMLACGWKMKRETQPDGRIDLVLWYDDSCPLKCPRCGTVVESDPPLSNRIAYDGS